MRGPRPFAWIALVLLLPLAAAAQEEPPAATAQEEAAPAGDEAELAELLSIMAQETEVATRTRMNSDYVPGKKPDVCPPENMHVQADVDVNSPEVQASIRAIVSHGTAVASTLGVYETFVPERAHLDSAAMEMLSPAARAEVQANHAGLVQSGFTVPVRLLKKNRKRVPLRYLSDWSQELAVQSIRRGRRK